MNKEGNRMDGSYTPSDLNSSMENAHTPSELPYQSRDNNR